MLCSRGRLKGVFGPLGSWCHVGWMARSVGPQNTRVGASGGCSAFVSFLPIKPCRSQSRFIQDNHGQFIFKLTSHPKYPKLSGTEVQLDSLMQGIVEVMTPDTSCPARLSYCTGWVSWPKQAVREMSFQPRSDSSSYLPRLQHILQGKRSFRESGEERSTAMPSEGVSGQGKSSFLPKYIISSSIFIKKVCFQN